MTVQRLCSKTPCGRPAVSTLTYVYADSTIVLGPLSTQAEPHTYDLCADHARRMTPPRNWEVVRLTSDFTEPPLTDDLLALADAVRTPAEPPARTVVAEAGQQGQAAQPGQAGQPGGPARRVERSAAAERAGLGQPRSVSEVAAVEIGRRGHLRVLRDE